MYLVVPHVKLWAWPGLNELILLEQVCLLEKFTCIPLKASYADGSFISRSGDFAREQFEQDFM